MAETYLILFYLYTPPPVHIHATHLGKRSQYDTVSFIRYQKFNTPFFSPNPDTLEATTDENPSIQDIVYIGDSIDFILVEKTNKQDFLLKKKYYNGHVIHFRSLWVIFKVHLKTF